MTRDVSIAPRNGRSADGSNSRTGGRSRVLNVQGSILKGIYRPLITLWYFVLPGQEAFGSHLMFLLTDGKNKLPVAIHFVSRSTALQEFTTLN